ncbi:hypothetical protein HMPREF9129_0302, partial [Peptoniphilus indolicus ATCC 29427]
KDAIYDLEKTEFLNKCIQRKMLIQFDLTFASLYLLKTLL